jgi:hypothetical protein
MSAPSISSRSPLHKEATNTNYLHKAQMGLVNVLGVQLILNPGDATVDGMHEVSLDMIPAGIARPAYASRSVENDS